MGGGKGGGAEGGGLLSTLLLAITISFTTVRMKLSYKDSLVATPGKSCGELLSSFQDIIPTY